MPALLGIPFIDGMTRARHRAGDWCPVGSTVGGRVVAFNDRELALSLRQVLPDEMRGAAALNRRARERLESRPPSLPLPHSGPPPMKSVSAAIITLAGAVVFAGAPASGKMMELLCGVVGIIVGFMGLITWAKAVAPLGPKP